MHDPAGQPRVTLKWAQTIDGRLATRSGHSRWVTGQESRILAHRLRAEHDAVLVGVGTVIADDPQLTVRQWIGSDPLRVVLDSRLRAPRTARLLNDGGRTLIVASHEAREDVIEELESRGIRTAVVAGSNDTIDLSALLRRLSGLGIRSVLVEGGARVITSFLRARLADEVAVFIAPKIVGTGINAVGDLGVLSIESALGLIETSYERCGADMLLRARLSESTTRF